jgi:hypothetical protein
MASIGVCFGYQCACIVGCSRSIVTTLDDSFWVVPVLHSVSDMTDAESIRLYTHTHTQTSHPIPDGRWELVAVCICIALNHLQLHNGYWSSFIGQAIRISVLGSVPHDSRRTSVFPCKFSAQAHVTTAPSDGVVPRSSVTSHSWGLGVWGCHIGVVEDSNILVCDTVSTGR